MQEQMMDTQGATGELVAAAADLRRVCDELRAALREVRSLHDSPMAADDGTATLERGATPRPLTPREREVAELIARGASNAEISRQLGISIHTARHHTESVLAKLGARSRAAVGLRLLEAGSF